MSNTLCQTPLAWLSHLERLCLDHACGLPQQEQSEEEWSGIGFRLGDLYLVAPLGEVAEILTPPRLSKVPRTKSWVCGIANIRGNLMPIMDLQAYLHDRPASMSRRSRILVISHEGALSGLVVDAVIGLRYFRDDQRCDELPGDDPSIQEYMTHGFRIGSEHWGVFSMRGLAEAPKFLRAAV